MAEIPNMTFEKIVEKTKLMLGKNYREPEIAEITEVELDKITTVNEETGELDTEEVPTDLEGVYAMVFREAAQWTNRFKGEQLPEVMNEC